MLPRCFGWQAAATFKISVLGDHAETMLSSFINPASCVTGPAAIILIFPFTSKLCFLLRLCTSVPLWHHHQICLTVNLRQTVKENWHYESAKHQKHCFVFLAQFIRTHLRMHTDAHEFSCIALYKLLGRVDGRVEQSGWTDGNEFRCIDRGMKRRN